MVDIQDLSSGKMSLEHFPQTKAKTLEKSSKRSAKSKTNHCMCLNLTNGIQQGTSWEMVTPLPGDSLMLNFGEYPKEENASTLSQILQVGVPEKYYLSQKACLGILRRAYLRDKVLPPMLEKALKMQASA